MLSLCSKQDMEGWLEGISSHGHLGLFQTSSVQVICTTEAPPPQQVSGAKSSASVSLNLNHFSTSVR